MFSGISTFGRLPYFPCLASDDVKYDIAFIGRSWSNLYLEQPIKVPMLILINMQVHPSILELHTDQELASVPLGSVKVLAVSISSQSSHSIGADTLLSEHRLT